MPLRVKEDCRLLHRYKCARCGQRGYKDHGAELFVHHIVAFSDGGIDDLSNLMALCGHCHKEWHRKGGDIVLPFGHQDPRLMEMLSNLRDFLGTMPLDMLGFVSSKFKKATFSQLEGGFKLARKRGWLKGDLADDLCFLTEGVLGEEAQWSWLAVKARIEDLARRGVEDPWYMQDRDSSQGLFSALRKQKNPFQKVTQTSLFG